jgi:hypothetical protein
MNKIWIALAAAVAGVIIPVAAQARDEGAWDSTRAHVQVQERKDTVQVGRADDRWDSTRNNVRAALESDAYTHVPFATTEQWDSTRRVRPSQPPQRTSSEPRRADNGSPLICACLVADDRLA